MSTNFSDHGNLSEDRGSSDEYKQDSIVGGSTSLQLSFEEKSQLFAPNRRKKSLLDDLGGLDESEKYSASAEGNVTIVSLVDWSSLTKSCKLAKNAFLDHTSGQNVIKKMFFGHVRCHVCSFCINGTHWRHRRKDKS